MGPSLPISVIAPSLRLLPPRPACSHHHLPGLGHPPDGQEKRYREELALGRDSGLHLCHLFRQDRHPHHQPDVGLQGQRSTGPPAQGLPWGNEPPQIGLPFITHRFLLTRKEMLRGQVQCHPASSGGDPRGPSPLPSQTLRCVLSNPPQQPQRERSHLLHFPEEETEALGNSVPN